MYLKRIEIRNIKCFAHLEIDFFEGKRVRRWTTLFGKNGLGKSTLLQAIGAALAGPTAIRELLPVAEGWVRKGEPYGEIIAELMWTEGDALTAIPKSGGPKKKTPYISRYIVTGDEPELLPELWTERYSYTVPTIVPWSGDGSSKDREKLTKDIKRLQQTAYSEAKTGWLACGYGPFRRLSGGGQDADRILYSRRISARFVTLFREDAALTSATEWLISLHNTAREGSKENERALQQVIEAFKKNLFPEPAELKIDARSVQLKVADKTPIPLSDLSDGYRSMLALSIDLLRWLINAFPSAPNPMDSPGVVLINELDAHLHPDWQRQIGHWLLEKFPKIQFIIATHSAFLAQVSDGGNNGNVVTSKVEAEYIGSNIVLKQTKDGVVAQPEKESASDSRVDHIYQSELFDLESLHSPKTEKKLKEHDTLHRKKNRKKLSVEEKTRYEQLGLWREGLPMLSDPNDRHLELTLQNAIKKQRAKLKEIS